MCLGQYVRRVESERVVALSHLNNVATNYVFLIINGEESWEEMKQLEVNYGSANKKLPMRPTKWSQNGYSYVAESV